MQIRQAPNLHCPSIKETLVPTEKGKESSQLTKTPLLSRPATTTTKPAAQTKATDPSSAYSILASQRLNRPISPHLTIYRPQVPWVMSGLSRISGSILSGGFYIFGSAYLAAPLFGWNLDSASMAAAFAAWPLVAQVATKLFLALPFTYHSWNGLRHLMWDMGWQMKNQQVIRSGWAVVGVSVVSALALAVV
jgi:succinate dehydrogenase (ubiquinone) cytochrome b560 subunit